MSHKPFDVYKRTNSKTGDITYYVRFYDRMRNRLPGRSSGMHTRREAERWAYDILQNGEQPKRKEVTFAKFAKDFWVWDQCHYVLAKRARNLQISELYVRNCRAQLDNYILTFFRKCILSQITTHEIEQWLIHMSKTSLSYTTINCCLRTLQTMFSEAERRSFIEENPGNTVLSVREAPKQRGILSIEEARYCWMKRRSTNLGRLSTPLQHQASKGGAFSCSGMIKDNFRKTAKRTCHFHLPLQSQCTGMAEHHDNE